MLHSFPDYNRITVGTKYPVDLLPLQNLVPSDVMIVPIKYGGDGNRHVTGMSLIWNEFCHLLLDSCLHVFPLL